MTENITPAKLSEADLRQFAGGTERYYRHGLNRNIMFTDGAKYVAEVGEAFWLLDLIAVSQGRDKRLDRQQFQVWKLTVEPDNSATITVEDGNFNVLLTQRIAYWMEIGTANIKPNGMSGGHYLSLDRLPLGGFGGHILLQPVGTPPPDPMPGPERPGDEH